MKLNKHPYLINSSLLSLKKSSKKRKTIFKIKNFYNQNLINKKITKLNVLVFLSEYVTNILKNYIFSSPDLNRIKLNIKLTNSLQNNIEILGKYLSKELIKNPRQFKYLFKKFTKYD